MCMLGNNVIRTTTIPKEKAIYAWKQVHVKGPELFGPMMSTSAVPEGGWARFQQYTSHVKPVKLAKSRTGFHAIKRATQKLIRESRGGTMLVPVKLWGKVVEHDASGYYRYAGFRAEHMEIQ